MTVGIAVLVGKIPGSASVGGMSGPLLTGPPGCGGEVGADVADFFSFTSSITRAAAITPFIEVSRAWITTPRIWLGTVGAI